MPPASRIFPGARAGYLLLQEGASLLHYDTERKRRIASVSYSGVKAAVWSADSLHLALLAKLSVHLLDSALSALHTVSLRTSPKSGAWCALTGAFLFTTELQLRYALPCGEEGALLSLNTPLYICSVDTEAGRVVCMDRARRPHSLEVNTHEYWFKAAVLGGREEEVVGLVKRGRLVGQGLLKFLGRAGRPELALGFIQDPLSR